MTSNKTTSFGQKLKAELLAQGAEFVYFVDISGLSHKQNKGFARAVLFGITLSPGYIQQITRMPEYVRIMIRERRIEDDEFEHKETHTNAMADWLAGFIREKGYPAYSQSENNIASAGFYDEAAKSTPLPHKTIAGLAGMGWIGRHNLLVTPEFGSAVSMCTVLTDAPINTVLLEPMQSKCGDCTVCQTVCSDGAIMGNDWCTGMSRDDLIDVYKCTTCLKCLVFCPWTQKYMQEKLNTAGS
ncbi:epoxyqueuosine reductase [bacterium]|nr:epoxyqueuosine reductase [bacterium]